MTGAFQQVTGRNDDAGKLLCFWKRPGFPSKNVREIVISGVLFNFAVALSISLYYNLLW